MILCKRIGFITGKTIPILKGLYHVLRKGEYYEKEIA